MKGTFFYSGFAAYALLVAQFSLMAAPTNAPAGNGRAMVRPVQPGIAVGGLFGVMTEQQRASYQAAMKQMRPQFLQLETQIRAAHKDLLDTSLSAKFDENLIRQKAMAAARLEAEMTVLRVKAYSQVQPPLSAEQIERIKGEEPGAIRPLQRRNGNTSTNHDANGLPPKR